MISNFRLRQLLTFTLILFGMFGAKQAKAQVVYYAGADLYIDYAGTGPSDRTYQVTLVLYKSCESASTTNLNASETVNCVSQSGSCGGGSNFPTTVTPVKTDTVGQVCAANWATNSCARPASSLRAYVRVTYTGTVKLASCTDWLFEWQNHTYDGGANINTNATVSSLPTGQYTGVRAVLNTRTRYNNSTPRYAVPSLPFNVCTNTAINYANGPYSLFPDSLTTTSVGFWIGNGAIFSLSRPAPTYKTGYSSTDPVASLPSNPYKVSLSGGNATFATNTATKDYLNFRTNAWDQATGNLNSYTERFVELDFTGATCAPTPFIDSTPQKVTGGTLDTSTGVRIISVCPGTPISFILRASNTFPSAMSITLPNISALKGATLTEWGTHTSNVTDTFNWTPRGYDIGQHVLVFTAMDSTCSAGLVGHNQTIVIINVLQGVDAGPDQVFCPPMPLAVPDTLTASGPAGTTYAWTDMSGSVAYLSDPTLATTLAYPLVTDTFLVIGTTPSAIGCKTQDTVIIKVLSPINISVTPLADICLNQVATICATVTPITGASMFWTPTSYIIGRTDTTCITTKPVVAGVIQYNIFVKDINGCWYKDSALVKTTKGVAPLTHANAVPPIVCPEGCATIYANVSEQLCGVASAAACHYTPADAPPTGTGKTLQYGTPGTSDPSPFYKYYYDGGERRQYLYRAQDLIAAGVSPGYISAATFILKKGLNPATDSFVGWTMKMMCTGLSSMTSSFQSTAGATTVYTAGKALRTTAGAMGSTGVKETIFFQKNFYWDGTSNILIDICYSTIFYTYPYAYPAIADQPQYYSTPYKSVSYDYNNTTGTFYALVNGCSNTGTVGTSSELPNIIFTECNNNADYTFLWTPVNGTTNSDATVADRTKGTTTVCGVKKNVTYALKTYATATPACPSYDTVRIAIDTSTSISTNPKNYVVCRPGYVQLGAQARGLRPRGSMACGTANPQVCLVPDTAYIGNPTSCAGDYSYEYMPFFYNPSMTQFVITAADLQAGGLRSSTIRGLDFYTQAYYGAGGGCSYGSTTSTYNIEISIACTNKAYYQNAGDTVTSKKLTKVFSGAATVGPASSIHFTFSTPYSWDGKSNLVIQVCGSTSSGNLYPEIALMTTSTSYVSSADYYYTQNNASFCNNTNSSTYGAYTYSSRPYVTFESCPAPDTNFNYTWKPGFLLSDSSYQNPTAYITQSTKYYAYTQGRNGCWVRDSISIYLPVHNYSAFPKDTAVCAGSSVQLHTTGGDNFTHYHWYQGNYETAVTLDDTTSANPVATPTDTTVYTVVFSDNVSCQDTITGLRIRVKPIPVVKAGFHDTTVSYQQSVRLYATGATVYTWYPTTFLNNPNVVDPISTPTDAITYTVIGLGADGCNSSDTVHVGVTYRGRVFVPSGFTPNGDGKNDRFRVDNMTSFEKVLEFRVFNRWGQEVFKADDNSGWDGKWQGVEQDMGVYQYLIRVAYPDGYYQTFKGDVTLIR